MIFGEQQALYHQNFLSWSTSIALIEKSIKIFVGAFLIFSYGVSRFFLSFLEDIFVSIFSIGWSFTGGTRSEVIGGRSVNTGDVKIGSEKKLKKI